MNPTVKFANGEFNLITKEFTPAKLYYPIDLSISNGHLERFLKQILPDENNRNTLLDAFASCLSDKPDENIYVLLGDGNSKDSLLKLFKLAMQDLCITLDMDVVNWLDSGQLAGKNCCIIRPFKDWNLNFLKAVAGGDEIPIRRGGSYKITAKFFMKWNGALPVSEDQCNRIKVINFPVAVDEYVDIILPTWRDAFMVMLLKRFK